ncbi:MAG: RecX family transcriptional regulator [Sneathiella sp.]|nr:RecX family transcriptional regulator [Sneathiella sp.]
MEDFDEPKKKERKPRPLKEVTPKLIRAQALRYLDRFATTTPKLSRHLYTKNRKAIEFFELDEQSVMQIIETEIEKLVTAGLMDDQEYADSKARSMARQGKSEWQIVGKLFTLGLDENHSDHAMTELKDVEGHTDKMGAAKYIKKRRFGRIKTPRPSRNAIKKSC